jgi:hypothetical protein
MRTMRKRRRGEKVRDGGGETEEAEKATEEKER